MKDKGLTPQLLNDMRAEFPGVKDITLERFLKGVDYQLDKAKESLRNYQKFRAELGPINIDDIMEELRQGAFYFHGETKSGNPIIVVRVGRFNPKQLSNGVDSVIKLNVWIMDKVFEKNGQTESCSLIVDCTGLGIKQLPYEIIKSVAHMYNTYYPEVLFKEFMINTPWLFRSVWGWLQGFLEESTRKKVFLLGSDYKDTLLEYIQPQSLQICYGGESTFVPDRFDEESCYNWTPM